MKTRGLRREACETPPREAYKKESTSTHLTWKSRLEPVMNAKPS